MKKNSSGNLPKHAAFRIIVGIFFSSFLIFLTFSASSQSYIYFENKIAQPGGNNITLYSFLVVSPDGTDTVRTRSLNFPSIEQPMADSVFTNPSAGELKYLVPVGETITDNSDTSFIYKLRFIFKRQIDSSGIYYIPFKTEYADKDGKWKEAETINMQQKTYAEMVNQKDFVSIFYKKDDAFYKFLFPENNRAVNISRPEKIFLVVVANTNDEKIGITSKKDFDGINNTFTNLAANLGVKLFAIRIMGNDFNIKNVDNALLKIKKAKPSSKDIVIFYYSGHGFRYSNDTSLYPRMLLTPTANPLLQDLEKNNLSVEDVYKKILKLGARVNIVMADCCNQDIGANVPVGAPVLKLRSMTKIGQFLNMNNVNALFFSYEPVRIIASSTQPYQLASGNPLLGGFFTYFFKELLNNSLYGYKKSESWLGLMVEAKEKARSQALTAVCGSGRCIQLTEMDVMPKK